MQRQVVDANLSTLAFEFFFWFSRFEFALKENGYLQSHTPGTAAKPGWDSFIDKWKGKYVLSTEANNLLASPPEKQIVGQGSSLTWKPVELADCKSDLASVVRLVKTIRNNLFHGGKHGGAGWDDPARTQDLLNSGCAVLNHFADMSGLNDDYRQEY